MLRTRLAPLALLPVALLALAPSPASAQEDPLARRIIDGLEARHVGPVGNRVSAVTGVPGDPNVFFIGAASGGIWKSTNGGHQWRPVFDDHEVQSIGALEVAPSDPSIVWAGTGEPWIRSNVSHGAGVFRSTDGGDSFEFMGLAESGRISSIVIHPTNPDVVYVGALGHLYGPQEERGVFRTTDGGATWERVLFADADTGVSDIWMHPENPDHLIAGMWTMFIRTWGRWSGGPADGLYESMDGGDTWSRMVGNGLPTGTTGKIGLSGSPDAPDRIYALIETNVHDAFEPFDEHEGVLWRSDDAGRSWEMINADHTIVQRPDYYTNVIASPGDADEVHFMATRHSVSFDGGFTTRSGGAGGDNHAMWIDPMNPDRMIVGHDGGISISTDHGRSWVRPQLPIAQVYHVTTDNEVPYNLYGNRQDGPSTRGPSMVKWGGSIPIGSWRSVGGCESGWSVPDTVNDVVWSGCYEGILDRHDLETRSSRTVSVWPDNPEGWEAGPLRYRFQWTFPIALSPHDPGIAYVGSQHLHRSVDGGQSWQVISPDLSTGADSLLVKSGGLTPDDVSPTYAAVLFAIAESPRTRGEIWAGTNDGKLWITRDDGGTWTDLTGNVPGLPELATISSIEPSRHVPGRAYLAVDGHQLGVFDPLLWVTEDWGATWRSISSGIPTGPLSFTHVLREDPKAPDLLWAGTGNALWVSLDRGDNWTRFDADLPPAPIHWIEIQPRYDDLVIATYGRGFWIADDITALQAAANDRGAFESTSAALLQPRDAWRYLSTSSPFTQPGDPAAGENGPGGAILTWWLPENANEVSIEITTESGDEVTTLERLPARAGLNRTEWGLRYTGSVRPTLRTQPIGHAHVELSAQGTRGAPDGGRVAPEVLPGRYQLRLRVDGNVVGTRSLTVLQDPASTGTMADMRAQLEMGLELREQANRVSEIIEELEAERAASIARLDSLSMELGDAHPTIVAERSWLASLTALEMELVDLRMSGGSAGQDSLRWPRQLFAKLTSLAGYISGTDDRPTDQAEEVHQYYREWLASVEQRLAALRRPIADRDGPEGDGSPRE